MDVTGQHIPGRLIAYHADLDPKLFSLVVNQTKGGVEILFFLLLFRVTPKAHGSSQARGQIGAIAADLHHSCSYLGSEPHLQPTLQLTAMLDPQPTEQSQELNTHPHGS